MFDYSLPVAPGPNQQIVGTPQDDQRRRAMADALAKQGVDSSPIRSKWQGVARLGDALAGALINRQADEREAAGQGSAREQMAALLGGNQSSGSSGGTSMGDALIGKQPAVADTSTPRGYRNNNPLNIEAGGFTKGQPGFAGSDGRFAKFENMDQGTAAAGKLLDTYQNKYGLNTVAGIVGRWAPAGDGNNVSAYAADVAGKLGIGPNDPLPPEMRQQLIGAMAQHENGRPMPTQQAAPVQVASLDPSAGVAPQPAPQAAPASPAPAQAATQQPPVQMAQNGGQPPMPQQQPPQFDQRKLMAVLSNPYATPAQQQIASAMLQQIQKQQMTPPELKMQKDMMGQDHPHIWDPVKRTYTPLEPGGQGAQAPASGAPQDIAATFERQYPGVTNRVAQLYRGEGAMPNARSNKIDGPAMQLIQQIHPDWNMQEWSKKSKMQTDLSGSGPSSMGGILSNGKSAFGHLANLSDNFVKLGSINGPDILGGGAMAKAGNYIGSVAGTSDTHAKIQAVTDNALKYGQESTKFYSGTGGGAEERMHAMKELNPTTTSGKEQAAFLATEKELMVERIRQKEAQVREVLGQEHLDKKPVMTDDLKAQIAKIDANIAVLRGEAKPSEAKGAAPKQSDPVRVTSPAEAGKLPKGTRIILPDGSPGVVP